VTEKSRDLDIVLKEYEFLRIEIMSKIDAGWKILTFETGGTSLILGFVFVNDKVELLPLVPFLILVTSFLYLGNTESVLNLGNYIHTHIEPDLKTLKTTSLKSANWEDFVRIERGPYKTIHISTLVLFMGMFYAALFLMLLSMNKIIAPFPNYWPLFYVMVAVFSVFGIVYIWFWRKYVFKKLGKENKQEPEACAV
jgi:hypothetical protein